ncbi:peptidyl-prolyl cis-trans isomerase A (cyclophilin A) [Sphingomonas sp. UYAg733]
MRPIRLLILALAALSLTGPSTAQPAKKAARPAAGIVRVRMLTAEGPIILALDTRRAPVTSANFLAYVDDGRFDGAVIYRSARSRNAQQYGFIQGGIRTDARRILPPFKHERTDQTGIKHLDGTISMARRTEPGSAGGNFFITVGALPSFDAKGDFPGYAAFGRVVGGMDTVKRILAKPTGGGMRGQMLLKSVPVVNARRLDGPARPTGLVKPWLINRKKK